MRKDPYMLEAAKFAVQDIASEGKPIDEARPEILGHLNTVYSNATKDDWADNLFMGVAYFLLGEKEKGMDCIAVNLDFGYEDKISGMLYAQMERGSLDSEEAGEFVHRMKLGGLIAEMNIADADTALAAALYFEGNSKALEEKSASSDNPVVFHALRLLEQSKGTGQDYAKVLKYAERHENLRDKISTSYSELLPLVRKYADEGREPAKILMADMLMYGWGIEQDTEKAREMFAELARGGNVYAQFVMIQTHLAPVEPAKKEETAPQRTYTKQELENLYKMGENYYYGRNGVKVDESKAYEYFLPAAEGGHAEAQYRLGHMYRLGQGVSKDLQKAGYWYEKAAAQGNSKARNMLDDMKRNGEYTPGATSQNRTYTKQELKNLYQVGNNYFHGQNGVSANNAKAAEYFLQAAEGGYADAQYWLGTMYMRGVGVSKDLQKAGYWYEKAAAQGHRGARSALDDMRRNGQYTPSATSQKRTYTKRELENLYQTGNNYYYGRNGVKMDESKAYEYFLPAAEGGHSEAQYNLGTMYRFGRGVNKDLQKARYWYEKATAQGNNQARVALDDMKRLGQYTPGATSQKKTYTQQELENLYNTGEDYYYGRKNGVKQDYSKACEYYLQAAEGGHAEAQFRLGYMYNYGHGIGKDLQKARYWYGKAAANGHIKARNALNDLNKHGR